MLQSPQSEKKCLAALKDCLLIEKFYSRGEQTEIYMKKLCLWCCFSTGITGTSVMCEGAGVIRVFIQTLPDCLWTEKFSL